MSKVDSYKKQTHTKSKLMQKTNSETRVRYENKLNRADTFNCLYKVSLGSEESFTYYVCCVD